MSHEEPPDTYLEDETYVDPKTFNLNFMGPVRKRSHTDVLCCIIFIPFITGYSLLGLVAWIHGNPGEWPSLQIAKTTFRPTFSPNENKAMLFHFNLSNCTSRSVVAEL